MDLERRIYTATITVRAADNEPARIVGYAAVFNSLSEDLGGFVERIEPGAFKAAVEVDDVRALINHDPNLILGRTAAGTLALSEDERGLRYEIDPPATQYARDLLVSLERGDVDQSSFGFRVEEESWDVSGQTPVRIIRKVRLFDVSPVTFPAYPATTVSLRAVDYAKQVAAGAGASDAGEQTRAAGRLAWMRNKIDLAQRL